MDNYRYPNFHFLENCKKSAFGVTAIQSAGQKKVYLSITMQHYKKRRFGVFFLIFFLASAIGTLEGQAQLNNALPYSKMADTFYLKQHIYTLASEIMKGRDAGSAEAMMAADYIKKSFEANQLIPLNGNSYLNRFIISRNRMIPIYMKIGRKKFEFGKDFYTTFPEPDSKIKISDVVFLGNDVSKWENSEIENKAVILLPGLFDTSTAIKNAIVRLFNHVKLLGAKAVLIPSLQFNEMKPSYGINKLNEIFEDNPSSFENIPVIYMNWRAIAKLIGKKKMEILLKNHLQFNEPLYDEGVRLSIQYRMTSVKADDYNVAGFIPGRDTNQFLIIGAHYDHVGVEDGKIYYGADDNASGTSAMLEISRLFSLANAQGYQPERSIIFVAFGAEERGLVGSLIFSYSGLYPNDSTTAMLNMDMIGRREEHDNDNYIYILGKDEITTDWKLILKNVSADFSELSDKGKPFNGFYKIIYNDRDPDRLIYRSDQYHFLTQNVPSLFFTDYMKKDYHMPTDTPDKIDYNLLRKRTQFIFLTAWELAFRKEMLSRTSIFKN